MRVLLLSQFDSGRLVKSIKSALLQIRIWKLLTYVKDNWVWSSVTREYNWSKVLKQDWEIHKEQSVKQKSEGAFKIYRWGSSQLGVGDFSSCNLGRGCQNLNAQLSRWRKILALFSWQGEGGKISACAIGGGQISALVIAGSNISAHPIDSEKPSQPPPLNYKFWPFP